MLASASVSGRGLCGYHAPNDELLVKPSLPRITSLLLGYLQPNADICWMHPVFFVDKIDVPFPWLADDQCSCWVRY